MDLVVVSLESWDEVWRRNQYLIAELMRADAHLRVLFVEPPTDPLHALVRRERPRPGRGLVRIDDVDGVAPGRLWAYQPTKLLPRRVDRRYDERHAAHVVRVTRRLGMSEPRLWINDPAGVAVLERTSWRSLYDITDDWRAAERTETDHSRLIVQETELLERCQEVVVCSEVLAERKGKTRPVTLVPNAVDLEPYGRSHRRPAALPVGAVVLYLGTVHRDRIDVELCEDVAAALEDRGAHLVLVGPSLLDSTDRRRLEHSGVVLTGPVDRLAVPALLLHADVLVVPHVISEFTRSLDPIKAYEYRAAGRPVVSTPVPGFEDGPLVTIAVREAFCDAVVKNLDRSDDPLVGTSEPVPTWASRAQEMRAVLRRLAASQVDPAGEAGRA